jgi:cytochrome c
MLPNERFHRAGSCDFLIFSKLVENGMTNQSNIKIMLFGILPMMAAFTAFAEEPMSAPAAPAVAEAAPVVAEAAGAIDVNAAIKVAKKESCMRCHGLTRKKEGPSYKVIAAFYKSNKDAEEVIYEHITTSPKVKLTDGHSEKHKAILDKTPEQIKNLVRWILSQ